MLGWGSYGSAWLHVVGSEAWWPLLFLLLLLLPQCPGTEPCSLTLWMSPGFSEPHTEATLWIGMGLPEQEGMDWERPDHCLETVLEIRRGILGGPGFPCQWLPLALGSARAGRTCVHLYVIFPRSSWHHQGCLIIPLGLTEKVGCPPTSCF